MTSSDWKRLLFRTKDRLKNEADMSGAATLLVVLTMCSAGRGVRVPVTEYPAQHPTRSRPAPGLMVGRPGSARSHPVMTLRPDHRILPVTRSGYELVTRSGF
eukprot:765586-Hanusia_phi.AAC.1